MSVPVFMSEAHIAIMRERLQASEPVASACQDLDRTYGLSFILSDGPNDEAVHWQMTFDPHTGVQVELGDPAHTDVTFSGSWPEVVRSLIALRNGEDVTPPMRMEGSPDVLERIAAAYAAAQKAATIETLLPEPGPGSGQRAGQASGESPWDDR